MAGNFDIKQAEIEMLYDALKKQYTLITALVETIEIMEKRIRELAGTEINFTSNFPLSCCKSPDNSPM